MSLQIILAVVEIFGLFIIGALARRLDYLREQEIDRWSKLVYDFLLPMFSFTTIINGIDENRIGELWVLPVIGLGQVLFATLAGLVLQFGLFGRHVDKRRTFLHFCAFNNYTYLPVIIFSNLWGEGSLATLFIMGVGSGIGVWTIGVAVLRATDIRSSVKKIITPNLIAIIAAMIIEMTFGDKVIPPIIMRILKNAGSAAIPLIFILIGSTLMEKGAFKLSWPVVYITIVRLIILPALSIPLLSLLPIAEDYYREAVLVALMPVAIATVIMTRRYGGRPDYAVSTALITTICSMATVPIAYWLIFH